MACRLFGSSHYPKQCWRIVNWTLRNKHQWNIACWMAALCPKEDEITDHVILYSVLIVRAAVAIELVYGVHAVLQEANRFVVNSSNLLVIVIRFLVRFSRIAYVYFHPRSVIALRLPWKRDFSCHLGQPSKSTCNKMPCTQKPTKVTCVTDALRTVHGALFVLESRDQYHDHNYNSGMRSSITSVI